MFYPITSSFFQKIIIFFIIFQHFSPSSVKLLCLTIAWKRNWFINYINVTETDWEMPVECMLGSSSSHGGLQTIKRNILQISVTAYISSHIIPAWCQLEVLIHLADKNLSNEWLPVTIMSLHKPWYRANINCTVGNLQDILISLCLQFTIFQQHL